jgi:hypothetical protein
MRTVAECRGRRRGFHDVEGRRMATRWWRTWMVGLVVLAGACNVDHGSGVGDGTVGTDIVSDRAADTDARRDEAGSIDAGMDVISDGPDGTITERDVADAIDVGLDQPPADATTDAAGPVDARPSLCAPGEVAVGTTCVPGPRQIAPASGSSVRIRRPEFRWELAPGMSGARVEICSDRACTSVVATFDRAGDRGAPSVDLPTGLVWWRLRGLAASVAAMTTSATWPLTVGLAGGPEAAFDFNGDGFADIIASDAVSSGVVIHFYVHHGSATGIATAPTTTLTQPPTGGARFGPALRGGDVNGDGFADLLLGSSDGGGMFGEVYVYHGGPAGLPTTPTSTIPSPAGWGAGFTVETGQFDLDADGYADLIARANTRVFVFRGGPTGVALTPASEIPAPLTEGRVVDDVNGDGYPDLVRGEAGPTVVLHLGGPTGFSTTAAASIPTMSSGVPSQLALAGGDVNGDGRSDLATLVPSTGDPRDPMSVGVLSVYFGGVAGWPSAPSAVVRFPPRWATTAKLQWLGDLNDDGSDELAVLIDDGHTTPSVETMDVFSGGPTGPAATPTRIPLEVAVGGAPIVWRAGDTNGDGFADLYVSGYDSVAHNGRGLVYLGAAAGIATAPARVIPNPDTSRDNAFATRVLHADVNNDGAADLVIGSFAVDRAPGAVYIFLGATGGLATIPNATLRGTTDYFGGIARLDGARGRRNVSPARRAASRRI